MWEEVEGGKGGWTEGDRDLTLGGESAMPCAGGVV